MMRSRIVHSPKVNPLIQQLKQSPIREITKRLEQAGKDPQIISFGGGQPSVPPPKFVLEKAQDYLKQIRSHRYSSTPGIPELRDAIVRMMTLEEGWSDLDPSSILVTQSATNGIEVALSTLAREGDEAVLVSPTYPGFIGALQTHGVRTSILHTHVENEFRLSINVLNEKITKGKTKMIIAINPDNPTGRILSSDEVKAIGELAQDNGMGILSDESYYRIIYGGEFVTFQGFLSSLIGIRSFSKTASATGWRIGYNYAGLQIADAMEKVNQFRTLCVAPFFQQMIYEFVMDHTQREEYVRTVLETYKARRDAMGASLRKWLPNARFVIPQAGFYYFIRLPGVPDDTDFSQRIFNEAKVAVVPGSAFGMPRDGGYFRLTFVSEEPTKIDEGIHRIADHLDRMLEKPRIEIADY